MSESILERSEAESKESACSSTVSNATGYLQLRKGYGLQATSLDMK